MFCFPRKKSFNVSNAAEDEERMLREKDDSVTVIALQPLHSAPESLSPKIREAIEMRDLPAVVGLLAASDLLASDWDETPLHMCMFYYCEMAEAETIRAIEMDIINAILDRHPGILDHVDRSGLTALHHAIQSGHLEVVRALLDSGATSHIGGITALHVAVKHPHILKFFLDQNDVENTPNETGRAPIHNAAVHDKVQSVELLVEKFGKEQLSWKCNSATLLHVAAQNGSIAVAKYLFSSPQYNHHSNICLKDSNGKTPLYLAAEHGHEEMSAFLLKNGAVLSEKRKKEGKRQAKTVVEQITRKFFDPFTFLKGVFDECIYEKIDCRGQVKLCVDYSVLTGNDGSGTAQIKVLQDLVNHSLRMLLLHPVARSLLCLKMKLLLPVFFITLAIYAIFLLAFNIYIFRLYKRGPSSAMCTSTSISYEYTIVMGVICCTTCLLLMQDGIIIRAQGGKYFQSFEYYVPLFGYSSLFLVLTIETITPSCEERFFLEHDLAFAAFAFAWLRAWNLLARIPYCGTAIFIMAKLFIIFFKFLMTASCLVFGLTFAITFAYYDHKTNYTRDPLTDILGDFPDTFENIKNSLGLTNNGNNTSRMEPDLENIVALISLVIITLVIFMAILWINYTLHYDLFCRADSGLVAGVVGNLDHQLVLLGSLDILVRSALGKIYKRVQKRRRHHWKIENYAHSDKIWTVSFYVDDHSATPYLCHETFNMGRLREIIGQVRRNERENEKKYAKNEKRDTIQALHDVVVGSRINECQAEDRLRIAKHDVKIAPIVTLRDKINTLEIEAKGMKESIDDMKECVKMLLIQGNQKVSHKYRKRSTV